VGDAVDSWKVIIVEPEKQLALLFGMKAPGLGRLASPSRIKAIAGNWTSAPGGTARDAGPVLLAVHDPRPSFYLPGNGETNCATGRTKTKITH
jgi:hypothetical protein